MPTFSPGRGIMLRMGNGELPEHSARVGEAVRMVRLQADCTVEEAFVLIHERATMSAATMEEVIDAVVEGTITFDLEAS
jgi:hypothetical protein